MPGSLWEFPKGTWHLLWHLLRENKVAVNPFKREKEKLSQTFSGAPVTIVGSAKKMGRLTRVLAECHAVFKKIFSTSRETRSQATELCGPAIESQRRSSFSDLEKALGAFLYSETTVVGWACQEAQNALESYRVINRFRQAPTSPKHQPSGSEAESPYFW